MALADRKWCLGCDTLDSFRGIPECCPLWEVLVLHIQGHGLRLKKKKKMGLKTVDRNTVGRRACHLARVTRTVFNL